jgi:3-isopropylmalate/(R)-2-methylmalate dehydratase small subunit
MRPFTALDAQACPLPLSGIDTDQLIPARFMNRTRAEGYGGCLLYDLRFDADGQPRPDFPLNLPRYQAAQVLVARRNFGSGSSREAAVYALSDFGFRCIVAPSFGDIFAANAVNNGVLPARVTEEDCELLLTRLMNGRERMHVSLEDTALSLGDLRIAFGIDPVWRAKLLKGWDDLDLTLSYTPVIADFQERDRAVRPWALPQGPSR